MLPRYIEIETSRYCNRNCPWCPNGGTRERNIQELMEWSLFVNLIRELKGIQYSGWLALHNYNEPLANPRLLREIKFISKNLPLSKVSLFTNGDYLNAYLFNDLNRLDISYMRVTLYPNNNETSNPPSYGLALNWLKQKHLDKLLTWQKQLSRQGPSVVGNFNKLNIEIICPEISKYNWRGGTSSVSNGSLRQEPCYMTSHSAAVDYQGRVKMCCNIFPGVGKHKKYILGSLKSKTFIEIWRSEQIEQLRSAHIKQDWSLSPVCERCTQTLPLLDEEISIYKNKLRK